MDMRVRWVQVFASSQSIFLKPRIRSTVVLHVTHFVQVQVSTLDIGEVGDICAGNVGEYVATQD